MMFSEVWTTMTANQCRVRISTNRVKRVNRNVLGYPGVKAAGLEALQVFQCAIISVVIAVLGKLADRGGLNVFVSLYSNG